MSEFEAVPSGLGEQLNKQKRVDRIRFELGGSWNRIGPAFFPEKGKSAFKKL